LLARIRANGPLEAALKGLPLNTRGLKKQEHELTVQTPCTLLYSFRNYITCIQTPTQALGSLMHHSELDSEAKEIIQAMVRLRGEYVAESKRK